MPSILDEILEADRRRSVTVGPFPLRGEDADQLRAARERWDKAKRDHDSAVDTYGTDDQIVERRAARLAEATEALDAVVAECPTFLVHAREVTPPERVDEIMAEHPATPEQNKAARAEDPKFKGNLRFNADTFPPAYLAEAIEAIEMRGETMTDLSPTQVASLYAKLNPADRNLLFGAAFSLRTAPTMVGQLGKG